MTTDLQNAIESAWEDRDQLNTGTKGAVRDAVEAALAGLDEGRFRVAERAGDDWQVNQWLKKAVLLSFRLNDMTTIPGGPVDPHLGGPSGSTRCRPNSPAGTMHISAPPASAPCPTAWSAAAPISRPAWC